MEVANLPVSKYACENPGDLREQVAEVGFLAVLKAALGAACMGVVRVRSFDEVREAYAKKKSTMNAHMPPYGHKAHRWI